MPRAASARSYNPASCASATMTTSRIDACNALIPATSSPINKPDRNPDAHARATSRHFCRPSFGQGRKKAFPQMLRTFETGVGTGVVLGRVGVLGAAGFEQYRVIV